MSPTPSLCHFVDGILVCFVDVVVESLIGILLQIDLDLVGITIYRRFQAAWILFYKHRLVQLWEST